MAGVPYHSAQQYIDVLIEKGYKVAIAEQMEDPKLAKRTGKTRGDPCGNTGNHYQCPGIWTRQKITT